MCFFIAGFLFLSAAAVFGFTPLSDEQTSFTVWVEDSDGQAVELEYDFNADNDKEDGYGTE